MRRRIESEPKFIKLPPGMSGEDLVQRDEAKRLADQRRSKRATFAQRWMSTLKKREKKW